LFIDPFRLLIEDSVEEIKKYVKHGDIDIKDKKVYTDEKWLQFILHQILLNCVKYQSAIPGDVSTDRMAAEIRIFSQSMKIAVSLMIEDNGSGIPAHELGRIFEKGFTGSNGRQASGQQATGMGLYLCAKLCTKMGIGIEAESVFKEYTRIILTFPVSEFLNLTKM
jgi:signal transduction histidine kinase